MDESRYEDWFLRDLGNEFDRRLDALLRRFDAQTATLRDFGAMNAPLRAKLRAASDKILREVGQGNGT